MRRTMLIIVAALLVFAAACGDSGDGGDAGDSGNGTVATLPSGNDGGSGTVITLPAGDGSEITIITGSDGEARVQIGTKSFTVPLDQCAVTSNTLLVSGETDEIAFALVTGVGLAMTLDPNDVGNSVAYVVAAPDLAVSGTSVTGSGEVQGVSATGFGDTEPWSIALSC